MHDDTEIGGRHGAFPRTRKSLVAGLSSGAADERSAAVEELIAIYWKPVYAYLRLRRGQTREDAKDLTQGFFTAVLERGLLADFDAARARFRTYLRTCLDRFASNAARAAAAQRRGGGAVVRSLDFDGAEEDVARSAARGAAATDPEAFFEGEWRRAVLAAAIEDLRADAVARGRPQRFELFRRYDLAEGGDERPTYEALARDLGLAVTDVTNGLAAARRDFRRFVLERLRAFARDDEEFDEDLRALLGEEAAREHGRARGGER